LSGGLVKLNFLPTPPENVKTFNPDFLPLCSKVPKMLLGVESLVLIQSKCMARDVVPAKRVMFNGKVIWLLGSEAKSTLHTLPKKC
jgi:hypothetical protein